MEILGTVGALLLAAYVLVPGSTLLIIAAGVWLLNKIRRRVCS